ncbi:MAG: hypothetical protein E7345_02725 [Clostridiales bacterium]|nr:hypothetical protein [Clostridiales bacterium]
MSKGKKFLIILILILVVAVAGVITYFVVQNKRNKTAETVMICEVNPQVQFLLNKNDKVMSAIALNEEGQQLLVKAEFEGKTADEASKLFIQLAVEAGYVELSTTGTQVSVDFSGLKDNYDELKSSVTNSINSYFDENGIIAGAVATVTDDLKTAINNVKTTTEDLTVKSEQELLETYKKTADDMAGISATLRAKFFEALDLLEKQLEASVTSLEATIKEYEDKVAEAQKAVDEAPELLKESLQYTLDLAQESLTSAKNKLNEAEDKFQKDIKETKESYVKQSEAVFKELKDKINSAIENNKTALEAHRQAIAENKADVQAKIDEYRKTLTTNE